MSNEQRIRRKVGEDSRDPKHAERGGSKRTYWGPILKPCLLRSFLCLRMESCPAEMIPLFISEHRTFANRPLVIVRVEAVVVGVRGVVLMAISVFVMSHVPRSGTAGDRGGGGQGKVAVPRNLLH